jgi:hypothetical protein
MDNVPVQGCSGCSGTAGVWGCPKHSPTAYVREIPSPFVNLHLNCPWCGKGIRFDGFKVEISEPIKL